MKPMRKFFPQLATLCLSAITYTGLAHAEDDCKHVSEECVESGKWTFGITVGAGIRTNPLLIGNNIPLVLVPQLNYYGKHFFIDNLDFGITLHDSATNTFNLLASPGYDRVFFYRYDLQNLFIVSHTTTGGSSTGGEFFVIGGNGGYPISGTSGYSVTAYPDRPREITYLAGPEWTFQFGKLTGQVDLLHEVTGYHDGNEIRSAIKYPLITGQRSLMLSLGVTWKSAAIVNYYYGDKGIYESGASLNPFVKLAYSQPLNKHWRLLAFLHYEKLGNAIAHSPIVSKNHVDTGFVGASYAF